MSYTSENFRQKIKVALQNLKANVANRANLIVSTALTTAQTYVMNVKATAPNQTTTNGEIYLQQQDVFLVEKISYYWRSAVVGAYTLYQMSDQQSTQAAALETYRLYEGTLSYLQDRTLVSSLLSLSEFNKRENTAISGIAGTGNPFAVYNDFDIDKCSRDLTPYWVLSGARDNNLQFDYANPFVVANMPVNCRMYANLQGVIIPNSAPELSIIESKGKSLFDL